MERCAAGKKTFSRDEGDFHRVVLAGDGKKKKKQVEEVLKGGDCKYKSKHQHKDTDNCILMSESIPAACRLR